MTLANLRIRTDKSEGIKLSNAAFLAIYAITNFSVEKFDLCRSRYDFLNDFRGTVVSGEIKLLKPDPAIFLHLLHQYDLRAEQCVFIDDAPHNVSGAQRVGMQGIHFQSSAQLHQALEELKLL